MPAAGVPLSFALPVEAVALNSTPDGRAPVSVIVGSGDPDAETLDDPAVPTVKVAAFADLKAGAVLDAAGDVLDVGPFVLLSYVV